MAEETDKKKKAQLIKRSQTEEIPAEKKSVE